RLIFGYIVPLSVMIKTIFGIDVTACSKVWIEELRKTAVKNLLGRVAVVMEQFLVCVCISFLVVMVKCDGWFISYELFRQIILLNPKRLVLAEISEFGLYAFDRELAATVEAQAIRVEIVPLVVSVQNQQRLTTIMRTYGVQTVYHAAAYKHVPIVEHNVVE